METFQRTGSAAAVFRLPGQEHAVARNLVDFTVVFFAAVRQELVVVADKVAVGDVSQFLGDFGGMLHVDEHENQVLFLGILVLAEQRVHKDARPELLVDRADKGNQMAEQEQRQDQDVAAGVLEKLDDLF